MYVCIYIMCVYLCMYVCVLAYRTANFPMSPGLVEAWERLAPANKGSYPAFCWTAVVDVFRKQCDMHNTYNHVYIYRYIVYYTNIYIYIHICLYIYIYYSMFINRYIYICIYYSQNANSLANDPIWSRHVYRHRWWTPGLQASDCQWLIRCNSWPKKQPISAPWCSSARGPAPKKWQHGPMGKWWWTNDNQWILDAGKWSVRPLKEIYSAFCPCNASIDLFLYV